MRNIGLLRYRLTFLNPVESRSFSGETTIEWPEAFTVWGSVEGLSGRDIIQAQQANLVVTHRIRVRNRKGVSHTQRIVWDGRTMEISSVVERENRTALEILAREVQ